MLIVFEGCDGSGKTTQAKKLVSALSRARQKKPSFPKAVYTREPWNNALRRVILRKDLDPITELLLILADRNEHIEKCIHPLLQDNQIVVCDRFEDSTAAYQGYGNGMDVAKVQYISSCVLRNCPKVNITFLLNVCPADCLARAKDKNKYEERGLEYHNRVYKGYLRIAEQNISQNQGCCVLGSNNRSIEEVGEMIQEHLLQVHHCDNW